MEHQHTVLSQHSIHIHKLGGNVLTVGIHASKGRQVMRVLAVILCVALAGCNSVPEREPQELFQQIPNWDGEASKVCCGYKWPDCLPHQTPRC